MNKIYIDTNIVLDLLARREPFYKDAAIIFSLADNKKIELSVSSLTFANISYILRQQLDKAKIKSVLRKLLMLVKVLSLDEQIVRISLNDDYFKDFEDCLQYHTAIVNGQEIIITRDLKDFSNSILPVMTASQFIAFLN